LQANRPAGDAKIRLPIDQAIIKTCSSVTQSGQPRARNAPCNEW
jgi:hypothetical protein